MLGALWNRLVGRRNEDAVRRDTEIEHMSPAERRFVEESAEDRQADLAVDERLGGIDPARLLDDGAPPRD